MQSVLVSIKVNLEPLFSCLLCYSERIDHLKRATVVVWRTSWVCKMSTTTRCFLMENFFLEVLVCLAPCCQDFTEKTSGRCKLASKHSFSLACSETQMPLSAPFHSSSCWEGYSLHLKPSLYTANQNCCFKLHHCH